MTRSGSRPRAARVGSPGGTPWRSVARSGQGQGNICPSHIPGLKRVQEHEEGEPWAVSWFCETIEYSRTRGRVGGGLVPAPCLVWCAGFGMEGEAGFYTRARCHSTGWHQEFLLLSSLSRGCSRTPAHGVSQHSPTLLR